MPSTLLVIGGSGFVGSHLILCAKQRGYLVCVTKLSNEPEIKNADENINLDILNKSAVDKLIRRLQPNYLIMLAAQSSVALSWENPALTIDVNIKGSVNIIDAIREYSPSTRVMMIGSSEEYGVVRNPNKISENAELNPINPYGITKAAQSMFCRAYSRAYNLDLIYMRAFNHIGAGQKSGFVAVDFCRQIVLAEQGKAPPEIRVGNLDAKRDFSDVRDIVRGYLLALEHGKTGEIYNIGSGRAVPVQTLLDILLAESSIEIKVYRDPSKMRPSDVPVFAADISKITRDTGYLPSIRLEQSLKDLLEYERGF